MNEYHSLKCRMILAGLILAMLLIFTAFVFVMERAKASSNFDMWKQGSFYSLELEDTTDRINAEE